VGLTLLDTAFLPDQVLGARTFGRAPNLDLRRGALVFQGVRLGPRLALGVVVLVVAGCSADKEPTSATQPLEPPGSVLAVVWQEDVAALVGLDPVSLEPAGGRRVRLGSYASGWSFSPDRSRLVLGRGDAAALRFVEPKRMRSLGDFVLRRKGYVTAIIWPRPDRILALVEWGAFGHAVVVIDAIDRRILARHRLTGTVAALARAGDGLAFLLGPASAIGRSRLVVVDADGAASSAPLSRVRSGLLSPRVDADGVISRHRIPGLAIAPSGERAVVVNPNGLVVEIDLRSLSVRYHELREPVSLLGRLRDWLEPAAHAKASDGPARRALWLGEHLVAVSGSDAHADVVDSGSVEERNTAAGLRLIDTRTWTVRTLDSEASGFSVTDELVLAYGALWDSTAQRPSGSGLSAYSLDGGRVFHLFRDEPVSWVQTAGRYAYAVVEKGGPVLDSHLYLVDLASGHVLRELEPYEDVGIPQILFENQL